MKTNTQATDKVVMVTIKILDQTGHTTLEQRIDEALATTFKQHYTHGKWPFVGTTPFEFTATGLDDAEGLLKDTIRLRQLLADHDEPTIVMTGPLQGGTN